MNKRLEQALRTLRAIRQRYETESDGSAGRKRSYSVQVALNYSDMLWITATIEALERTATDSAPAIYAEGGRNVA